MKQYRYIDFDCPTCGTEETRFVNFDTDTRQPTDPETCGAWRGVISGAGINYKTREPVTLPQQDIKCDGVLVPREMSGIGYMKPINKNNSDFNERERERLEKRSNDHWIRQGRDEAIDRERAMLKKNGMIGGVK